MAALQLKSSHTEQHTVVETVDSLGLEVLPHPPYSSDLAPSDYHLSGPMKKMLSGQKFASNMQVQWAVHQWLVQQPTLFFALGIHKVVERWDKCLNKLVEDMSKKRIHDAKRAYISSIKDTNLLVFVKLVHFYW